MGLPIKTCKLACLSCLLVLGAGQARAFEWMPLNVSGSLGYNFRMLDGSNDQQTISNQGLGTLYANTYLWRPWLATTDAAVTLALDKSTTEDNSLANGSSGIDTNSSILTGTLNLNVLPQSRTPFNLHYAATDTRVDTTRSDSDAFIVLNDADASSRKLGLRQSLIADGGHRLAATYDNNRWHSERTGYYEDQTAGLALELRGVKQRATLNGRFQEATRSISDERNESTLVDASHYFYPTQAVRVDTRASSYSIDRNFEVPSTNNQSGLSSTDIQQASSFLFYRPPSNKVTLSGGVRVYNLAGENDGLTNEANTFSATGGAFYQYSRRMRYDANLSYTTTDSNDIKNDINRQHVGMLYQSEMTPFRGFDYSWFGSGSFDNVDETRTSDQTLAGALGHNLGRNWFNEPRTSSVRFNFGQHWSESYQFDSEVAFHRLEHTVSLGWNGSSRSSDSYVQLSLSDLRGFGDNKTDQQFANLQANRTQKLNRRSALSGNLTLQSVRQNYDDAYYGSDSIVTTITGRINYSDSAIFSVPRLRFNANWYISEGSSHATSRQEAETRLDYTIGKLTSYVSYRYIQYEDLSYNIIFFRVERQF